MSAIATFLLLMGAVGVMRNGGDTMVIANAIYSFTRFSVIAIVVLVLLYCITMACRKGVSK